MTTCASIRSDLNEVRKEYSHCNDKYKFKGLSCWMFFAGFNAVAAGCIFLLASIEDTKGNWDFVASLVQYSLPFTFLTIFIPLSHASLYDNSFTNRISLFMLSLFLSSSIVLVTYNGITKYRNGFHHPHNVAGDRYDTLPNFLGSNLTISIFIELSRLSDISVYSQAPCAFNLDELVQVQTGSLYRKHETKDDLGQFKFRTSEAELTENGRKMNNLISPDGNVTDGTYILWNKKAILYGGNPDISCNYMYHLIALTLPSRIFSPENCIQPFANTRLCLWVYNIRLPLKTEFLERVVSGEPNTPSRIIRVSLLNRLPSFFNVSEQFMISDLAEGNGLNHFAYISNNQLFSSQFFDYGVGTTTVGLNSSDTLNYKLSFHERKDSYDVETRWYEIAGTSEDTHIKYNDDDLRYASTRNNLDINLEIEAKSDGSVEIETSVSSRSFDFSDLVTYLCSIGSSLFAVFGLFFPNSLPKRYNAFYPTSKKAAQKNLNEVDDRLEESICEGKVIMSKISTNNSDTFAPMLILERLSAIDQLDNLQTSTISASDIDINGEKRAIELSASTVSNNGNYSERIL